jgi:hypothetical protein
MEIKSLPDIQVPTLPHQQEVFRQRLYPFCLLHKIRQQQNVSIHISQQGRVILLPRHLEERADQWCACSTLANIAQMADAQGNSILCQALFLAQQKNFHF